MVLGYRARPVRQKDSAYLSPANPNVEISWTVSVASLSHCADNHIVQGIGTGFLVLELEDVHTNACVLSPQQQGIS